MIHLPLPYPFIWVLLAFIKTPGYNFKASMFPSMFFVPIFIDFSYKIGEASRKSRMSLYLI